MKKLLLFLLLSVALTNYCIAQPAQQTCLGATYPNPIPPPCRNFPPCGIYVIQNVNNTDACANGTDRCYKLHPENYDGIFIKIPWEDIQPINPILTQNTFDPVVSQKLFDIFEFAASNGVNEKQVSIAIIAGNYTPTWVGQNALANPDNNITGILNQVTHFGLTGAQLQKIDNFPVPWDIGYITAFNNMITNFRAKLLECATCQTSTGKKYIDYVRMIKLTGVNIEYEELRLPNLDDTFTDDPPTICTDDFVNVWLGNTQNLDPYTPANVKSAFNQMASHIQSVFSDKWVNLVVIPNVQAFPPIDINGDEIYCTNWSNCTQAPSPCTYLGPYCSTDCHHYGYSPLLQGYCNLSEDIIIDAMYNYSPCLAINSTALTDNVNTLLNASPYYPYVTFKPYSMLGYQQHADLNNIWTPAIFQQALLNGLLPPSANFLELFPNTIHYFSNPALTHPQGYYSNMTWAHEIYTNACGLAHREEQSPSISIAVKESLIHINNEGKDDNGYFAVYNMLGEKILSNQFEINAGANTIDMGNQNLPPAIYIIKLLPSNGNVLSCKFIVK